MKRRAAAAVFGQEGVENTTVDPGCNSGLRIGAGAAMGAARWRGVLLAGALLAAVATMAAGRGSRDMAIPPHGRRTLLLTELFEDSLAFDGLTRALGSLGHKVEIKARKEIKWEDPVLMDGSRRLYDNVVLLGPWGDLDPDSEDPGARKPWPRSQAEVMGPSPTEVGDFFDAGGNVFLTAHPNDGDFDDQVLALFGASLRKGVVEDSRSNVETLFDHQLNIPVTTQVAPFLGWCPEASKRGTPRPDNCYVLYDGGAFAPGSGGAEYPLLPLVWGEDSAGLTGGGKGEAGVKGRDVVLAAGFQGRHNARAVFLASYTAVSDAGFFTRRGNGPLMEALLQWAFNDSGQLRVAQWSHRVLERPGLTGYRPEFNPREYRVGDRVRLEVALETRAGAGAAWVPYNGAVAEVAFSMMNPYVEGRMASEGNGLHSFEFWVPERHGIFRYQVKVDVPGMSLVHVERDVTVRPVRTDEMPRFAVSAIPYFASTLAMLATSGALAFTLLRKGDDDGAEGDGAQRVTKEKKKD